MIGTTIHAHTLSEYKALEGLHLCLLTQHLRQKGMLDHFCIPMNTAFFFLPQGFPVPYSHRGWKQRLLSFNNRYEFCQQSSQLKLPEKEGFTWTRDIKSLLFLMN